MKMLRLIKKGAYVIYEWPLSCIAKATCHTYQDHIVRIPSLSINSTKQLYTDIGNLIFYFFHRYIFKFFSNPYMAWA